MRITGKHSQRQAFLRTMIALALLATTGCGTNQKVKKPEASGSADASSATGSQDSPIDEIVIPPKEYYDALMAETMNKLGDKNSLALVNADQVLWVNFGGVTLNKGFGRDQSFVLCQQTATIAAPALSSADRDEIINLVKDYYSAAGAKLIVTQDQPGTGDFTTINVGGAYRDLGCIGIGVLGVAPFDVGNADKNDIGFAFTDGVNSNSVIAETIAHEAGHTFGLEHVVDSKDLMYASSSQGITGFGISKVAGSGKVQDEPGILKQVLGTGTPGVAPAPASNSTAPVAANGGAANNLPSIPGLANLPAVLAGLPGLSQIAGIGSLLAGLQAGNIADISTLIPQLLALVPGLSSIVGATGLPGIDKILTIVGLASTAGNAQQAGATLPTNGAQGIQGIISGVLAGNILNAQSGGFVKTITGLAALAGFGNVSAAVGVIEGILNGGGLSGIIKGGQTNQPSANNAASTALTNLPDLAAVLGLSGNVTNIADLINSLNGSALIVNSNFSGANQDALLSLLKVAYGQLYQTNFANIGATNP